MLKGKATFVGGTTASQGIVKSQLDDVQGNVDTVQSNLNTHTENTDIHITTADKNAIAGKLDKIGGTMTGDLYVDGDQANSAQNGGLFISKYDGNYSGRIGNAWGDMLLEALQGNFNMRAKGPVPMRLYANAVTNRVPFNFNEERDSKAWVGLYADYNGTTYRRRGTNSAILEFNENEFYIATDIAPTSTFTPTKRIVLKNDGKVEVPGTLEVGGSVRGVSLYENGVRVATTNNTVNLTTAQTVSGLKTFNAPANIAGTEQATTKFMTSNGGSNNRQRRSEQWHQCWRFDQVDGTERLKFRGSATAGAMVWSQPENGSQLLMDLKESEWNCKTINF